MIFVHYNIIITIIFSPLPQALDGFLFVVNTEGRVEYVTDNITQYINYTKDDVLGKDIYNIIHHGDHNTFMPSLSPISSLGVYGLIASLRRYVFLFFFAFYPRWINAILDTQGP